MAVQRGLGTRWTVGLIAAAVLLVWVVPPAGATGTAGGTWPARRAPRGEWVTVSPSLGLRSHRVREYVTAEESRVVRAIEVMVRRLPRTRTDGRTLTDGAQWFVEPAAESSPVLGLQRRVLDEMATIVGASGGMAPGWQQVFVAARTQAYIRQALDQAGCDPGLARSGGVVLMGASVCDRRVVITNITGYAHLTHAGQQITAELEGRHERPIREVPHRLVVRAAGGLAHELVHSWRAAPLSGQVRADEPAWFAEGLAEFWAGIAVARALGPRHTYLTQHVLRSRDFADWARQCPLPLERYRAPTPFSAGCEYHVGLLAVERLHAVRPDLLGSAGALGKAASHATFAGWFREAYGISLDRFERETDAYIAAIRRAEARG